MNRWLQRLPFIVAIALAVIFIGAFLLFEGVREIAFALLRWFEEAGAWGILAYILFYTLIVVFILPAVIFTLGAGFVFGFWLGLLVILSAIALGSTVAFLIARHALGPDVGRKLMKHPKLNQLNKGLRAEGWKIVMLSRLVPGFPFKLSNYFFGVTAISFKAFFFGNLAGVLPFMLVNIYVGSMAGELTELAERDRQPWEWILYGLGLLAAVALLYYIRQIARRSMERTIGEEEKRGAD
jgi:uncharacterized membrane protein YdjX (TVP38/TMEM64 family)